MLQILILAEEITHSRSDVIAVIFTIIFITMAPLGLRISKVIYIIYRYKH